MNDQIDPTTRTLKDISEVQDSMINLELTGKDAAVDTKVVTDVSAVVSSTLLM